MMQFSTSQFLIPLWCLLVLAFTACSPGPDEEPLAPPAERKAQIQEQLDLGAEQYYSGEYALSEQTFREIEGEVEALGDTFLQIQWLIRSSELEKQQGDYGKSLEKYFEAAKLAELFKDTFYLGLAHYNISAVFTYQKHVPEAKSHNQIAATQFAALQDEAKMANCKVQRAIIVREAQPDSAKVLLQGAYVNYTNVGDLAGQSICFNTLGNIAANQEKYREAIGYYEQALAITQKRNKRFSKAIQLGNLGEMYLNLGEWKTGKVYVDSSLHYALEVDSKEVMVTNYERLQAYFQHYGELDSALHYADLKMGVKVEILTLESQDKASKEQGKLKRELELAQAQNHIQLLELRQQEDQQTRLLSWLIGGFALALLGGGAAFLLLMLRKERKVRSVEGKLLRTEIETLKVQKEAAQLRLDKEAAESRRLEEALDYKRRTLVSLSLNLREKEALQEEIREAFGLIKHAGGLPPAVEQKVQGLLKPLAEVQHQEIYEQIESMNESFHAKLKTRFRKLSEDDIRLASLVVLGMSSKGIANVLHIEAKSVDMKKYRLKKKLGLGKDEQLKTFLHEL